LLHANDSRDAAGSGADRHANLGDGQIDPVALRGMIRTAAAPVICETPGPTEAIRADLEFVREALAGDGLTRPSAPPGQ
jgi:deoxyribonuclease-4